MENISIFQSPEWEEFRLKSGYQKSYRIDGILVLQKRLPFGRTMLYSPMVNQNQISPLCQGSEGQAKIKYLRRFGRSPAAIVGQKLYENIKNIAVENNSIFYRVELDIPKKLEAPSSELRALGFAKAFEEMQPEHTLILNITKSEEEILAQMKQKGRYNIKIAEKNNIEINSSNAAGKELDQFYDLYSMMAKRHGITYRSKTYFEGLIDILGKKDYARIYIAQYKDNGKAIPVVGAIITFYGDTAIYLYGGSSNLYRNTMAPYFLHWQAILDAKERGCKKYDFFGIAPNDDPKHPWAGVTRFKQQFGGEEVHTLGSYDLILKPLEYSIFKIAEKIRRH